MSMTRKTRNRSLLLALSAAASVAFLTVAGGSQTSAQQAPAPGQQKTTMERGTTASRADIRTVTVTVKDVDRADHKVTFEAKVAPEANLMRNGEPIRIDQLQKGDSLRMQLDTRTGEIIKAEVVKKAPSE